MFEIRSQRHKNCQPSDSLKRYEFPRINNNFFCLLCAELFSSPALVADHYVAKHNPHDLKKLGYHPSFLLHIACQIKGGVQIKLADIGVKAKAGRPAKIPDVNVREKNFKAIQFCPEFELQMLMPYCQKLNITVDDVRDCGIVLSSCRCTSGSRLPTFKACSTARRE